MAMNQLRILVRGAGDIASGIAYRLCKSGFKRLCMTEVSQPLAVRRGVSFCEAIHDGEKSVEGVTAVFAGSFEQIQENWMRGKIPVVIDPGGGVIPFLRPEIVVDAILAKKNLGTRMSDAALVIGIGPGFYAGRDTHSVIESKRGHSLGRIIREGEADRDTGVPGIIEGYGAERVFRSPEGGAVTPLKRIGEHVEAGEKIAVVGDSPVEAQIRGIIRGMIREGTVVTKGVKIGDIDPRGIEEHCYTVSDKALSIAGGVLEAILDKYNS